MMIDRLTTWVLSHKRLVVGFWIAVTVVALAAIGPAGKALSDEFSVPGREGFETNHEIAALYGNGGDVAPLVPVVHLPTGRTVDDPGVRRELAGALGKVKAALPDARVASYASTGDRAFVSEDGRTTFALVYIPAEGGVDPGQAEARLAQSALAGVSVGGSPVEVTGLDALRAGAAGDGESTNTGALVETLAAALGALLVLIFVFRSFMAVVPLLMALVAIPTTFLLVWPLAALTDVSVIVQFLVALIGLGIAIDYALLVVVRWREERQRPNVTNRSGGPQTRCGTPARPSSSAARPWRSRCSRFLACRCRFRRSIGIAGPADRARQRRRGRHAAAGGPGTIGPSSTGPALAAIAVAVVGLGAAVVRHRGSPAVSSTASWPRSSSPPPRSSSATRAPTRSPTAAPARASTLQSRGIGTGRSSPFDALVRSGDPDRVAAALAGVDGVRSATAPVDWRRDGTALVSVIPTEDGNSPAGRATLDRIRDTTQTLPPMCASAARRPRPSTSWMPSTATSRS
jgi:RND superfamily putative drug exporter